MTNSEAQIVKFIDSLTVLDVSDHLEEMEGYLIRNSDEKSVYESGYYETENLLLEDVESCEIRHKEYVYTYEKYYNGNSAFGEKTLASQFVSYEDL